MKRLLKYGAWALLPAFVLLLAFGGWLFGTSAGALWLLQISLHGTPLQLEVRQVSGRLLDELRLEGIVVRWPRGAASSPELRLRWRPQHLLTGHLAVQRLDLAALEISLDPPVTAAESEPLAWPQVTGVPDWFTAEIASLQVARFALRATGREPLTLGPIALGLGWDGRLLNLSGLYARTPYGTLSGQVEAGLAAPVLNAELAVETDMLPASVRTLSLKTRLSPGEEGELLSGAVELTARTADAPLAHLAGEVGLSPSAVELRRLRLTRSGGQGVVGGTVMARLDALPPLLALQLELFDLDLMPETGVATALSGSVQLEGAPGAYHGRLDLANRGEGWRDLSLAGQISGDLDRLELSALSGTILGGRVVGDLEVAWRDVLSLQGAVSGTALDPALLLSQLTGRVNLELGGRFTRAPGMAPVADLQGTLHDSVLNGQALAGMFDVTLVGEDVDLRSLELHGKGFDLSARGRLQERLGFAVAIPSLGMLLPEAAGRVQADGWLRRQQGALSGGVTGHGEALALVGLRVASVKAEIARDGEGRFAADAALEGLYYSGRSLDALDFAVRGLPSAYTVRLAARWPQGRVVAEGSGGYAAGRWQGEIARLEGEDQVQGRWSLLAPVAVDGSADGVRFPLLRLESDRGERLSLALEYFRAEGRGTFEAGWEEVALGRANPWLPGVQLAGNTSGTLSGQWTPAGWGHLTGSFFAAGRVRRSELDLQVARAEGELSWDEGGLLALCDVDLAGKGSLSGRIASVTPPPGGRLSLELTGDALDLALLAPWLPPTLTVAGRLSGSLSGEWLTGGGLALAGRSDIGGGSLAWEREEGTVTAELRTAEVNWRWEQEGLVGDLALVLADYGTLQGRFALPLPARWPAALRPDGALRVDLRGALKEQGLLAASLPGLLRESRGDLDLELHIAGTWQSPELSGGLRLSGAGAYLPVAGIELRDLAVQARLAGNRLRIDALEVRSGEGTLRGEGDVRLGGWRIEGFRGSLEGDRFLTVNLPELRLEITPQLVFEGTGQQLKVRGELRVPELLVSGRQTRAPLHQHADVVMVDAPVPPRKELPMDLDTEVRVTLGERVLVRFGGIDARLAGAVTVHAESLEKATGRGEIHVVEGSYAAYGMRLKVSRGNLLFAGGPVDLPTLDILALRSAGEVKAGVRVTGTPRAPVVKLYSEPVMPETDVLSYIVLGRPMGGDAGQASLLLTAAGVLLSKGESTVLQDRVKRRLGLDVLDIQAGNGDASRSVVTVGKYLNPRLYVSLGYSLFTNSNVLGLRYSIGEHWEAESSMGEESGVDLFYRIEFR